MLSNEELPYVGRFAYGWHRLATTDPHAAHGAVYDRYLVAVCRRLMGVRPPATAHTSRAPAPRSVRAAADSVAPVVMTSSTTSTRRGITRPGRARKAGPAQRSADDRPVWGSPGSRSSRLR